MHYSKTYDDAPMPLMERLTWDGIALHAGKLPGYPASHGCVRLPKAFAEKLYAVTQIGTPVIIADDSTQPASVYDPGLLLGAEAKDALSKTGKKKKPTFSKSNAVTSILVERRQIHLCHPERRHRRARKGRDQDPGRSSFGQCSLEGDENSPTAGDHTARAAKPALRLSADKPPADVQLRSTSA
jgi:hypothetical protein